MPSLSALRVGAAASALIMGATCPALAWAGDGDPVRVTPQRPSLKERWAERKTRDFSDAGTERGTLEFVLGSLTAALALGLIGRGTWELVQGQRLLDRCTLDPSADPLCVNERPSLRHEIAAGLSFGFVVPAVAASGFLFWRGARTLRDYRAFHARNQTQASLRPTLHRHGGSLTLHLRF